MKEIQKACITCKNFTSLCDDEGIGECDVNDTSFDESFFSLGGVRVDKLLVRYDYSCIYWDYFLED